MQGVGGPSGASGWIAPEGGDRVGAQWGERRRYTPMGSGGGGGRPTRVLVAVALAVGLVALRAGVLSHDPGARAVKAWVAQATTTPMGMKAPWEAAVNRAETFVRGGLDGHGWHWPPADGGMRVRTPQAQTPPMSYPVAGVLLVPFGGGMDPVTGKNVASDGIVLAARAGSTVRAPCSGTVTAVRAGPPVGQEIIIRPSSRPDVTVTLLGVDRVQVRPGQSVNRSEAVGVVAATGPRELPSLVMEVRIRGIAVDPLSPLFLGPAE